MYLNELDLTHAQWMLDRQIDDVGNLIHFWLLAGPISRRLSPRIESVVPIWYHDLPEVATLIREKRQKNKPTKRYYTD